jgi:NhaP-type Na+/H+ or K+/H+ antiporter
MAPFLQEVGKIRPALFWLFLGGFFWVVGDLFQQYAAKYIGIGRGIPLSNTNQLWGLAWGALVFGELAGRGSIHLTMVIGGSIITICGAIAISSAEAPASEQASWKKAMRRECDRYGLNAERVESALAGEDPLAKRAPRRSWWEMLIFAAALAIFIWLAIGAESQPLKMSPLWSMLLILASLILLIGCAVALWKRTRFS